MAVKRIFSGGDRATAFDSWAKTTVCAAAAVASAVSAALDGRPVSEVLAVALQASTGAESLCPCGGEGSTIAASIRQIHSDLAKRKYLVVDELANQYFPNKPENIVPRL